MAKKKNKRPFASRRDFKKQTETSALTQAVIDYGTLRGCVLWRQNNHPVPIQPTEQEVIEAAKQGGKLKLKFRKEIRKLKGVSDIQGALPWGQILCVEIKTGRDKQSAEQIAFMEDVLKVKGEYLLIRNIDEFIIDLNNLLNEH